MPASETTWLGLIVDGYLVTDEIGNGGMSRLYRARHIDSGQEAVIKVVATVDGAAEATLEQNQTSASQLFSGGFGPVRPSPWQLMSIEWKRGLQAPDALCCVGQPVELADCAYGVRPLIVGRTLRQEMTASITDRLKHLSNVVDAMITLEKSAAGYHGDLKPDNVIVQERSVKLIDPGFFGSLHCLEGDIESCAVTTAAYYPFLENDDLFAFGLMTWEVLLLRHPLTQNGQGQRSDIAESLRQWIRGYEIMGRHFAGNLLSLVLPSELRSNVSTAAETFLLNLLRLRRDSYSGKLEMTAGFGNFDEVLEQFHHLDHFPG